MREKTEILGELNKVRAERDGINARMNALESARQTDEQHLVELQGGFPAIL